MSEVIVVRAGRFDVPLWPEGIARWHLRHLHVPATFAGGLRALLPPALMRGERSRREDPVRALLAEAAWALEGTPWRSGDLVGIVARDFAVKTRGRTLAILFERHRSEPCAVLKLEDAASPGPSLEAEGEALRALASALPPELASTVPAALASGEREGRRALVTSIVPGRPALARVRSSLRRDACLASHVERAFAWLAAFQRATARGPGLAAGHGDLWWRNVLTEGGGAVSGVVDWERFRAEAPVQDDAFDLALSTALDVRAGARDEASAVRAVRRAFVDDASLSALLWGALRRHAEASRLDPSAVRAGLGARLRAREAAPPFTSGAWRAAAEALEACGP